MISIRKVKPGQRIASEDRNALVDALKSTLLEESNFPPNPRDEPHPWKVFVDQAARTGPWKIYLRAGFVNDTEAFVPYLATGDARGWTMPEGFPSSRRHGRICDRSWRETKEQPFFLASLDDMDAVPDGSRPDFFCTEQEWEKDLFVTSVWLSASPVKMLAGIPVPPFYRTFLGRFDSTPSYPYGTRELARIYASVTKERANVSLFVDQLEYYDLAVVAVEPARVLVDYNPVETDYGIIGGGFATSFADDVNATGKMLADQVNAATQAISSNNNTVEWWSL